MASLHVITRAEGGLRIPGVTVRLRTGDSVPLGCAGWPGTYDVTLKSDERGVADFNLGDFCSAFGWVSYLSAETPKGRTAQATWDVGEIQYGGDYTFALSIPGALDEGSPGAEAADAWAVYGPWILLGAAVLGGYAVYRLIKRGTEPRGRD